MSCSAILHNTSLYSFCLWTASALQLQGPRDSRSFQRPSAISSTTNSAKWRATLEQSSDSASIPTGILNGQISSIGDDFVNASPMKQTTEHASITGGALDFQGSTEPLISRSLSLVKKVVLVRHGLSSWNEDSRIQVFRFCRSKCHKNFKMKRNPRKVKWTKAYRKLHGKELTQDTTFEFERKRNRPERYDRNVVENTLKAMKKIEEVRVNREAKFWESRMKGKKTKERKEAAKELEQSIHLVKAPLAMQEEPGLTLPKNAEKLKVKVSISKQQTEHSMEE